MPLVLGLRRGQDFTVAGTRFIVSAVRDESDFTLTGPDGREHRITDIDETEILPRVFVKAGERQLARLARVSIRAPREIHIGRGGPTPRA